MPPSDIEALYNEGHFIEAAAAGAEVGSAEALTLAARANIAAAMLETDPTLRDGYVDGALAFARAALEIDAEAVEAHLQAAIALGLVGRRSGPISAHARGLARIGRAHIDDALALDPENPWGYAALGAWHLEVVAGGGAAPARLLYGARRDEGLAAFARAVHLAPDNLVVRYERAMALLAFDAASLAPVALEDLAAVAALEPRNAIERALKVRAAELVASFEDRDADKLAENLAAFRGGYERPDALRFRRVRQVR